MLCVAWFSTTLPSTLCFPSSLSSSFSFSWSPSSSTWETRTLRTSANEESGTMAENDPLTGYEPKIFDDYHISETTDIFIQESSGDSRSLNLHDLEFDDNTIGMALSSPLFTQEREDAASRRQAYHSLDEGLSSSQSSSVGHVRTGRPVSDQFDSAIPNVRENPRRGSDSELIRFLLERQKEQILADCRAEIQKHEFQADYDKRSIQKLNEVIESQRGEIYRAHQGDEQHRRDQQLLHEQWLEQNRDLREAHEKSLNEMEELKRFQGSTFDTIAVRKLVEDRDTILELTGNIQELQNEINCMNDSRDFQDAESVRSGQSHVTSQPVFFPTSSRSWWKAKPFSGNAEPQQWAAKFWDTHGISGNVFANPTASSSAPYPQELNPWSSDVSEHTSPHVMSESQTPVQDQRCQSRPSARNSSVIPIERGFSKNYGADQQRLQISDPHFDKFPTSATFACWKITFKTEVCTCSQFPTEAMLCIKEAEFVESVEDLKSSCSIRGIRTPDFEVLDAKIASALIRITRIPNWKERSVWRNKKHKKRTVSFVEDWSLTWDWSFTWSMSTFGHRSQRFCRELCRPIYNCSSKWWYSGIRFRMERNFIINDENSTWWHLGRIVQIKNTRVWEAHDRIGIVQYGDSSEENRAWLSQIETMVNRSIEQNLRIKNFDARNGNYKRNAVVKNQETTAWTKNSRRLLAVESQRAVF